MCYFDKFEYEGKVYESYKVVLFDPDGFSDDKFVTLSAKMDDAKRLGLDKKEKVADLVGKTLVLSGKMSLRDKKLIFNILEIKA